MKSSISIAVIGITLGVVSVAFLSHAQVVTERSVCTLETDQSETAIAVSPVDSMKLMITWNGEYMVEHSKPGYSFSTDGGNTWGEPAFVDMPDRYAYGFDPSCAFDTAGTAYYCYVAQKADGTQHTYVSKTTNMGSSWSEEQVGSGPKDDKPYMAVDNISADYKGNIYVSWVEFTGGSHIYFARSTDGGFSFEYSGAFATSGSGGQWVDAAPRDTIASGATSAYVHAPVPAVGPDGEVYVVWVKDNYDGTGVIYFRKSTDGGYSFSSTDTVACINYVDIDLGWLDIRSFPTIAVDPNNGYVYVAYTNDDSGNINVRFVRSTDGGSSWSEPEIATVTTSGKQFFPWLSVDPATGRISLIYYNNASGSSKINVYVAWSTNNGDSFSNPNKKVTSVQSDPDSAGWTHHYAGIVSAIGYCYPCWTDYRNGDADVYMARVDYPPSTPTGVQAGAGATWVAIIWDANPEDDIDEYLVWRYTNSWTLIDSTSNTYYLDYGFDPDPDGFSLAKYRIKAKDNAGQLSPYSSITDTIRGYELQEKVSYRSIVPIEFSLSQNYPNPFNHETEIEFTLPEASNVRFTVYNILGQIVEVLVDSEMQDGYHALQWSGKEVSSGVYFYQLTTDKFADTKRMILMK